MTDERPAPLDTTAVREMVAVAHGDLGRVRALLEQESRLVNAAWDWGGGDWETPLGAAAHMGRRDIAEYLLEHGARLDLFAAAMLGKLEIVQAVIAAFPGAAQVAGPHGITLVAHAKAGGPDSAPVAAYLEQLAAS
jgi:hypothetical protein